MQPRNTSIKFGLILLVNSQNYYSIFTDHFRIWWRRFTSPWRLCPNGVYDEQILPLRLKTNCPGLDRKNALGRKGVDLCFNVYTSRSLIFTTMSQDGSNEWTSLERLLEICHTFWASLLRCVKIESCRELVYSVR